MTERLETPTHPHPLSSSRPPGTPAGVFADVCAEWAPRAIRLGRCATTVPTPGLAVATDALGDHPHGDVACDASESPGGRRAVADLDGRHLLLLSVEVARSPAATAARTNTGSYRYNAVGRHPVS